MNYCADGNIDSQCSLNARAIALSSGELWQTVKVEAEKVLTEKKGGQLKALKKVMEDLCDKKYISDDECADIILAYEWIFKVLRGKESISPALKNVSEICHRLTINPNSSPVSIAILGVIKSVLIHYSVPQDSQLQSQGVIAFAVTITPGSAGAGAVVGAGIGAGVGAAVGGPLGAAIGAGVGAAAGAAIGACNAAGV